MSDQKSRKEYVHITSIPVGMKIIESKHIRETLEDQVKSTHIMCDLYIKGDPNRHCRDMKCDGYKIYFCYTRKK